MEASMKLSVTIDLTLFAALLLSCVAGNPTDLDSLNGPTLRPIP